MSEKFRNNKHNNNPENSLTSRRTDGGKKYNKNEKRERTFGSTYDVLGDYYSY